MKAINYIVFLMSLLFILSGCEDFFETTLELEEPEFEPQLVVSAVFEADRTFREMLLTETVSLNQELFNSNGLIYGADISLTKPSGETCIFESYEPDQGFFIDVNYGADCSPFIEEGEYTLSVKDNLGREVFAKAALPKVPSVLDTKFEEDGGIGEFGEENAAIDITIDDEKGEENYYMVSLWGVGDGGSRSSIFIESNDPSTDQSRISFANIVTDRQFDGQEYRLRILFPVWEAEQFESFQLYFAQISKDQYRFDKILESASENEDNPFTSPVQLHSNVEGGLGLFAIQRGIDIDIPK